MANVYVSINRGTNMGDGTIGNPFKFLWKAAKAVGSDVTIHIAAGRYPGQGKTGVIEKFAGKNIRILGGYTDDFSARNPFQFLTIIGAPEGHDAGLSTATVLHIEPTAKDSKEIVIDGIVIDRGEAAIYFADGEPGANQRIEGHKDCTPFGYRGMNTKQSGTNPTITVISQSGNVYIRNCILINNPWWGIYVKGGGNGEIRIENNLILSYQGRGIESITGGGWGNPQHIIRFNTILFGRRIEGRAISADPKAGAGTYAIENNVLAYGDQAGVVVKFKDPPGFKLWNNVVFGFNVGDYNIGGTGICNVDELEDNVTFPCGLNLHAVPGVVTRLHQAWMDRWSQSENLTSKYFKEPEIMATRAANGLAEFHLAGYPTPYPSYGALPQKRPEYMLSRYPHPMKIGQQVNFVTAVLPALGADGERGIQATPIGL